MKERDKTIDVCKGVGILLVLLGHLPFVFGSVLYTFHMGFFFMLSGYCFSDKHLEKPFLFIKKRFMSLAFPYLFWVGINKLLIRFVSGYGEFSEQYHLIGTLWFLRSLFESSLIVFFMLFMLKKLNIQFRKMYLLFALIILTGLLFLLVGQNIANKFYISTFFFIGYCLKSRLYDWSSNLKISYNSIMVISSLIVIMLVSPKYLPLTITFCSEKTYLAYMLVSLIGSSVIYIFCRYLAKFKLSDIFVELGQNTMPIIIFQWAIFCIVDVLMENNILYLKSEYVVIVKILSAISISLFLNIIYKICKHIVFDNLRQITDKQ